MYDSYQMDHAKGLMIVDCRGGNGKEPDLKDPGCLASVLVHLSKEFRVDGLVLNHYREKHYGGRTLEVLNEVIALSSLLRQLTKQRALPRFKDMSKKESQDRCVSCPLNPAQMFTRLRDLLLGDLPKIDFPAFGAEFTVKARELDRHRGRGCSECTERTVKDMEFLLVQIDSFTEKVLALCKGRCEK